MNYKENMAVSKLMEHPENKKLFKDIKETNPTFWLEFLDSIRQDGIIEPLIVNKNTMQVRSGNQRLKAALELGLETVPVLLIDETTTDDEIRKMISSNVYRRTIDPFAMFEYIGRLRKKSDFQKSSREVAKEVHKKTTFVKASDIWRILPTEDQEALKEWFEEKAEGEKAKSEGELIVMIKSMEVNQSTLKEELKKQEEKLQQIQYDKDEMQEEKERVESLISGYESDIEAREKEIEEWKNSDFGEERQLAEKEINEHLIKIKDLKTEISKLNENPDLNFYLIECNKNLVNVNKTLRPLMENYELLNPDEVSKLEKNLKTLIKIVTKGTENKNSSKSERKLLND